jgi:uncharacterized protein (TIRG00374 family)
LALGLVLLALAARGIQLGTITTGVSQANPTWVFLAFLSVLGTTACKILRWQHLFLDSQRPTISSLTAALLVGQLLNAVLPARLGDVGRAYAVSAKQEHNVATVIGTVAAEKTFDVLMLMVFATAAAATTPLPNWLDISLLGIAIIGVLLIAVVALIPDQRIAAWSASWDRLLPLRLAHKSAAALLRAKAGLSALRRPSMALISLAWSFAVWMLAACTNFVLFLAFDLRLSFGAALMLLVLLHIGIAPPSSPGRLGVFHALTVAGLAMLGIEQSLSLAYATVLHALVYLPQILPGVLLLAFGRVSISTSRDSGSASETHDAFDGLG